MKIRRKHIGWAIGALMYLMLSFVALIFTLLYYFGDGSKIAYHGWLGAWGLITGAVALGMMAVLTTENPDGVLLNTNKGKEVDVI